MVPDAYRSPYWAERWKVMADWMPEEPKSWTDFVKRVKALEGIDVIVTMGSDSDWREGERGGMWDCVRVLVELGVAHETFVTSAHRTARRVEFLAHAANLSNRVVIAAAGGAAHLPGMFKAHAPCIPVIGVPIIGNPPKHGFDGMDALLSIVNMPPGVPVATVGMGAAANAALLAASMVGLHKQQVRDRLHRYIMAQSDGVPVAPPKFVMPKVKKPSGKKK